MTEPTTPDLDAPEGKYSIFDRLKGWWPLDRNDDLDDAAEEALADEFEKEATDYDGSYDPDLKEEIDQDD